MVTPRFSGSTSPPLVGREREQAILRDHLAAALNGRGSLVLIGGEAGIGKTTLAEALCTAATAQGALVLVGRCYDLTETPPYGPWIELFERYQSDNGPPLPDAFAQRGPIREVASQAALFQQVQEYFTALCTYQPFVLLLDDLHWSDPASLDLLRILGRSLASLPLLVLVTYRSDELSPRHPLYALLPMLVREAHATRLDLHPLTENDLRELIGQRYHLVPADTARLIAYLHARAEGNPFFLGELLRTLEEEQVLRANEDGWTLGDLTQTHVPALLRQVIDARLARLDEEAQRPLAMAAVIGQEIPLALWAAVTKSDEERLLDVVEQATVARIVETTGDGTRIRFVHALIRESLYAGILPMRRRMQHRHIGEVLAAVPDADPDGVAYHFQQADDERAAKWLVVAGRQAQRAYAWLTAADRYETAAAMMQLSDTAVSERGWLLYHLAMLRRFTDPRQGIAYLDEVIPLANGEGNRVLAAHALFARGLLRCYVGEVAQGVAEFAESIIALEHLPVLDMDQQERLAAIGVSMDLNDHRGTYALWLSHAGRFAEAQALGERVIAAPPPASVANGLHGAAYGDALWGISDASIALGRSDEARQASIQFSEMMTALGHDYLAYRSWVAMIRNNILTYYTDQVTERHAFCAKADEAWVRAAGLFQADDLSRQLDRIPILLLEGQWAEARRITSLVSTLPHVYDFYSDVGRLAHAQGDSTLARQIVQRILPHGPETSPGSTRFRLAHEIQLLAATLALDTGDFLTARAWLDMHDRWLAWSGAILGQSEGHALWARYYRVTGDTARACGHAERALTYATKPRQPLALLGAYRLLGELDTDAGRHADAEGRLDAALALADICAAPYERALTLLALAELHVATGNRTDAGTLLDEVHAICAPLGAKPALARVDALAERLANTTKPTPAYPDDLTPREAEVLRLIAAGRSNREIAAALFISTFTVNRHVENVYRKIGVHGRADATAYAFRHRLT